MTPVVTYLDPTPVGIQSEPISPRRRMGATELEDLYATGHTWIVEFPDDTLIVPRFCRYCDASLARSAPLWECEFDGTVSRRPTVYAPSEGAEDGDRSCECNRCIEATNLSAVGSPRKVCEAPECQALRKRDKARAYRERKAALPQSA